MGKLVSFIIMLVVIDLLFLITGQLGLDSPSSLILDIIQDPSTITQTSFWTVLITGVTLLAAVGGVVAGIVTRSSDVTIFIVMGSALALLIGDFAAIYILLANSNRILATIIMSPILIIFSLVIIEWIRGKDWNEI